MLSFNPQQLMTPGGVINGAGNAIAALASVPAHYRAAQATQLRNQLMQQALAQKAQSEQDEMAMKGRSQDWLENDQNPNNAHLRALDANMKPPLTFEQQLQLRQAGVAQPHQHSPYRPGTVMGGLFPSVTNTDTGQVQMYDPASKSMHALAGPAAAAPQAPQPNPAIQALQQPGAGPQVPRAGMTPPAGDNQVMGRAQELMQKVTQGTASAADTDELTRIYKQLFPGEDPMAGDDQAGAAPQP